MLESAHESMDSIVDNCRFYHKDRNEPLGRTFFKEDGETRASLAQRGWVDDPGKAGYNPWPNNPGGNEFAEKMKRDCEEGLIPRIADPSKRSGEYEREQLRKQSEKHAQEIADRDERIRQLETAARVAEQSEERLQDERSDAGLLKETKHKGKPKTTAKSK